MAVSRYKGTAEEVIKKLEEDGHYTGWYRPARPAGIQSSDECGVFTTYLLDGEWAWTHTTYIDKQPKKYQQYRKIKPVSEPKWYCSGCKLRWPLQDWKEAMEHYRQRKGQDN